MLMDPHHLNALAAILRHGSFDAAASELSVTPSAISQRIKALEDRIGTSLINRGSPCTATPAGLRIAKHAEDIGLLESQLARDLTLKSGPGPARVRIALPADVLAAWFIDVMTQVPDLLFDLVIDDQEHSADWLRRGEVSAAITVGGQSVTGCDTHTLGAMRYLATASPGFVSRWFADGVDAKSLACAPCLVFNRKDGLQRAWMSARTGTRLSPPSHFLPSSYGFVDAAIAGLGWGMNPEILVRDALREGRLCEVVAHTPLDVTLNWQVGRALAPALSQLTKAVKTVSTLALFPEHDPQS